MSLEKKEDVLDPTSESTTMISSDQWDWFNKHVERRTSPDDIVSPSSTIILAGPALYAELASDSESALTSGTLLTPIGFLPEVQHGESQVVTRHHEIGSGRSGFTVGKSGGRGSIARALFDADSLLVVLGRNSSKASDQPHVTTFAKNTSNNQYAFGLWSDAFKIPFGMAFAYKTIGNDFVASEYLEMCLIGSHQIQISSSAPLVMENVQFQYDRARTVNIRLGGPSGITDSNA